MVPEQSRVYGMNKRNAGTARGRNWTEHAVNCNTGGVARATAKGSGIGIGIGIATLRYQRDLYTSAVHRRQHVPCYSTLELFM